MGIFRQRNNTAIRQKDHFRTGTIQAEENIKGGIKLIGADLTGVSFRPKPESREASVNKQAAADNFGQAMERKESTPRDRCHYVHARVVKRGKCRVAGL
jgi:hypothetical protein